MRTSAIVAAAGRSSRMGASKMRLAFGSSTVLGETISNLLSGGVEDVCVVLGRDAVHIERDLQHLPVKFVHNPDFAHTDMLYSIKMGLEASGVSEATFVMPGDSPLVSPAVIGVMKEKCFKNDDALIPTFRGEPGHPVLLSAEAIRKLRGEKESLRHLLKRLKVHNIPIWDRGILMDVDTPEAYQNAMQVYNKKQTLHKDICRDIWDYVELPPHIRAHNEAVAKVAVSISRALNHKGHDLDVALVEAASLLHDVCRCERHHEKVGADFLRRIGYSEVADVIAKHMYVKDRDVLALNASAIVFYADKITEETCRVTPAYRYHPSMQRFPEDTDIGAGIRKNLAHAEQIEQRLKDALGDVFVEALSCQT